MSSRSLTGKQGQLFECKRGAPVTAGNLPVRKWYRIEDIAGNTKLPAGFPPGSFFRSPASGTAIALTQGDRVSPLALTRICKTNVSVEVSESTVAVTDDCSDNESNVLTGYTAVTGSIDGFLKVDEDTGELVDTAAGIMDRFFAKSTDTTAGGYTYAPRSNTSTILMVTLNADAGSADKLNWLILPVILTGLSTAFGNTEPVTRNVAYQLSDGGIATRYVQVRGSGDIKGA